MRIHRSIAVLLLGACISGSVFAQTTQPVGELLAPPFKSLSAGISISPPLGTTLVRGAVGSSEVARFVDEKKNWALKVSRVILEPDKPLPLTVWSDAKGNRYPGILELTADQFMNDIPGAQELRRDTTTVHGREVGMHAARFSFGLETNLTQQAIIPTSKIQYYIIAMTTPAPREGELENDPGVLKAVATFNSVLNSVEMVDQTELQKDRDERLNHTRVLYGNLSEAKLRSMLHRGQWLRVIRNGKEAGYTYVVEEIARDLPRKGQAEQRTGQEGVLIGMRSRMVGEDGGRVDSESWSFCTFDRKYEAFSTTVYTDSPRTGKSISGDIGFSRWRQRPVAVAPAQQGIGAPRGEMVESVEYKLEVNKVGRNSSPDPIVRDLPPYYLPQAMGILLPRLVETRTPHRYLFASWVNDASQVMFRYVDVQMEQDVNLNGRRVRAIPIQDRIGLEGSITTHYISPERQYLGSTNTDTRTTIIATDSMTLERLWRDADLSRPGAVER